jgi:hypothetical protein
MRGRPVIVRPGNPGTAGTYEPIRISPGGLGRLSPFYASFPFDCAATTALQVGIGLAMAVPISWARALRLRSIRAAWNQWQGRQGHSSPWIFRWRSPAARVSLACLNPNIRVRVWGREIDRGGGADGSRMLGDDSNGPRKYLLLRHVFLIPPVAHVAARS